MDIIIIDDNVVNRKLLNVYAKKYEKTINVLEADDGDTGLEMIFKHKDTIGLILLDIYMPKMTGFQVLDELEKQNINIPVIVLSTDDTQEENILRRGVNFVHKPVKQNELLEEINETLNELKD